MVGIYKPGSSIKCAWPPNLLLHSSSRTPLPNCRLIRFCAKTSEECNKFGDEWHELADELLEEQIWAADVDVDDSPEVAERFQIFSAPTYILLRNRKMLIKHSTGSKTELWEWALDGWQAQHSLEVPPARMTGFATIENLASQGAAWHMLVNKLSGVRFNHIG